MAVTRERVMERLRELRHLNGSDGKPLSQEDAAHLADITTRQWQRWESGESMPYPKSLGRVADAFGISIEFFETAPADRVRTDLLGQLDGANKSQLDRIEFKLDVLLLHFEISAAEIELSRQGEEPDREPGTRRAA